jgi:L-lactate dehydrogenase complex protein LldE
MRAKLLEVGLLVTCLVDLVRPIVGFAAVKLLEAGGCAVTVPRGQTCCGQPAHNSGDRESARRIARQVITAFDGIEYVVVPSGSCAAMIRLHYPTLFADEPETAKRAEGLARRTHELVSFVAEVLNGGSIQPTFQGVVTYHDSCSGLRELGIKDAPRALLSRVKGLELKESSEAETCCGFGGTFCVKYPDISASIVDRKADDVLASGAGTLLSGDLGCLLNIAGRLQRRGSSLRVRHVAEVLAGMADGPAIGEGR